jgi:hypothetical protein
MKPTAAKKAPNTGTQSAAADTHWFPDSAKAATAATAPVKKTSPWQRRAAPVSYGLAAVPGTNFKQLFNTYIDEKHRELSTTQREELWKVVGTQMISEPLSRLNNIIDQAVKAPAFSK